MTLLKIYKTEDCDEKNVITTLYEGEHIVGRDKLLDCDDKRVSRNHALIHVRSDGVILKSVHVNPCYFKPSNENSIHRINKDSTVALENGDQFALVLDKFWYKVKVILHNTEPSSSQNNISLMVHPNDTLKRSLNPTNIDENCKRLKTSDVPKQNNSTTAIKINCYDTPSTSLSNIDTSGLINSLKNIIQEDYGSAISSTPIQTEMYTDDMTAGKSNINKKCQSAESGQNNIESIVEERPSNETNDMTMKIVDGIPPEQENPDISVSQNIPVENIAITSVNLEPPASNALPTPNWSTIDIEQEPPDNTNNPTLRNDIPEEQSTEAIIQNGGPNPADINSISTAENSSAAVAEAAAPKVTSVNLEPPASNANGSTIDIKQEPPDNTNNPMMKNTNPEPSTSNKMQYPIWFNVRIKHETPEEESIEATTENSEHNPADINSISTADTSIAAVAQATAPRGEFNLPTDTIIKKAPERQSGEAQKGDSNCPGTSNGNKTWRDRCWYGHNCYRKNTIHRSDLSHPGDEDYDSDPNDPRSVCPFGPACYRINMRHRRAFKHFGRPAPKPSNINVHVNVNSTCPFCTHCSNNCRKPGYESDHDSDSGHEL
ncbi:hypothetical protein JTB14_000369 [Gonioctena quinquepunctata]|nr:hypothetical protein JTB14_000369 [Gonioctena quinquepunctata]